MSTLNVGILVEPKEQNCTESYPWRASTLNHVGWGDSPEEALGVLMRFLVDNYCEITVNEIKVVRL